MSDPPDPPKLKLVDGVEVELTPEEIAAIEQEWADDEAAWAANPPAPFAEKP